MGWLDSNGLRRVWENIRAALAGKQDKLIGTQGQMVGFDANGKPVAQSTDSLKGDPGLFYGTCSTAASTAAKAVALSGFTLATDAVVAVKFTCANTAASPTLNVNSTGAKAIKKYGTTAIDTYMWQAGAVVEFVYDGTSWIMLGGTTATTTYYGLTKLSSSVSSTSATEAATPSAVKQAYDLASAALPRSGGTMTGALSVLAPTADAHAATKKYVDDMIAEAAAKIACLTIFAASGDWKTNLKLYRFSWDLQNDYTLPYGGQLPYNMTGALKLEPPPGYAFTGLADTWLPALRTGNQNFYGALQSDGSIMFSISTSYRGGKFEFVSSGMGGSPARLILEVA